MQEDSFLWKKTAIVRKAQVIVIIGKRGERRKEENLLNSREKWSEVFLSQKISCNLSKRRRRRRRRTGISRTNRNNCSRWTQSREGRWWSCGAANIYERNQMEGRKKRNKCVWVDFLTIFSSFSFPFSQKLWIFSLKQSNESSFAPPPALLPHIPASRARLQLFLSNKKRSCETSTHSFGGNQNNNSNFCRPSGPCLHRTEPWVGLEKTRNVLTVYNEVWSVEDHVKFPPRCLFTHTERCPLLRTTSLPSSLWTENSSVSPHPTHYLLHQQDDHCVITMHRRPLLTTRITKLECIMSSSQDGSSKLDDPTLFALRTCPLSISQLACCIVAVSSKSYSMNPRVPDCLWMGTDDDDEYGTFAH